MMSIKPICVLAGLAAAGAFSLAVAGSPADYFNKIDADASGVITQTEYVAYKTAGGKYTEAKAAESFMKLAGDDGQLTLAEYEGAMKKAKSKKADCEKSRATTT